MNIHLRIDKDVEIEKEWKPSAFMLAERVIQP
jgi:hypothetical protein